MTIADTTKRTLRELWGGFSTTTSASWVGVLLFCLAELAGACWLFQPRRLATFNRFYLMDSAHDEYGDLSYRLIAFRRQKLTMKHVSFMGPSNATRSLSAHDDDTLSEELTTVLGSPAHFDVFTTNNQRIEDALQIVDQFPPSYRGVAVLQIHDSKDDYRGGPASVARNRRRLALPSSPSIVPIWEAQGVSYPHTGIFLLDHFEFFAARRIAALRWKPPQENWESWGGSRDQKKFEDALAKLEEMRQAMDAQKEADKDAFATRRHSRVFTRSRKVLAKIVLVLKKRHVPLLLVDAPRMPTRGAVQGHRVEAFHQDAEDFCARTGATFVDFNPDMELDDSDFQDAVHLGSRAKRRLYTDLLMGKVVEMLNAEDGVGHATPSPTPHPSATAHDADHDDNPRDDAGPPREGAAPLEGH